MTDAHSTLQIPDSAVSGPSRPGRAASVGVQPNSSPSQSTTSRKTRASHAVVSPSEQRHSNDHLPTSMDVNSHPAVMAYASTHPRRQIPKFGPYLLLQTLGEGEFAKVRLGLHSQYGEEVAVKLIRRGTIADSAVRLTKVEREIEVLRTLKHPNIVRLYDVIETDKYIGIIIEYASGGELFDHILAHRYLKERDAAKLFSQLISGVWYIHQKQIVHRDLKLENLLLDRHRNVIITDFGFANRFEHRSDDLMQTSCGSPCYAAPELVISEGLYAGSAVDIWSCGVILYAMLAGYLPFDDDPANPDGDNINLLYKYIVNTPLSFPDYISAEARDLLSMMLVPDPAHRATLPSVMAHPWLAQHAQLFQRTVEELEQAAMDMHYTKRLAYQRQMKQGAATQDKVSRHPSGRSADQSHSRSRHQQYATQPDYLYETSGEQAGASAHSQRRAANSASETAHGLTDGDAGMEAALLAGNATAGSRQRGVPGTRRSKDESGHRLGHVAAPAEPKKGGFRHTIQVEYDNAQQQQQEAPPPSQPRRVVSKKRENEDVQMADAEAVESADVRDRSASQNLAPAVQPTRERKKSSRKTRENLSKPLPEPPITPIAASGLPTAQPQDASAAPTMVDAMTLDPNAADVLQGPTGSLGSQSSQHSKHRRGLSMDKIGLGKLFGSSSNTEQANGLTSGWRISPEKSAPSPPTVEAPAKGKRPGTFQLLSSHVGSKTGSKTSLSNSGGDGQRTSRRNTLTVMVEPFRSRKNRSKQSATETPSKEKAAGMEPPQQPPSVSDASPSVETPAPPVSTPAFSNASNTDFGFGAGISASTNKARKVMHWFRSRSKGRDLSDLGVSVLPLSDAADMRTTDATPTQAHFPTPAPVTPSGPTGSMPMSLLVTPSEKPRPVRPERTASTATDVSLAPISLATRVRRSVGLAPPLVKGAIRVHRGAVDTTMVTDLPPPEVMKHVREVLLEMGVEFARESDFKFRCLRPRQKRLGAAGLTGVGSPAGGSTSGLTAFTLVGTAASNGVDRRGLPLPSVSTFGVTGGMLKGLLMRRQSSQVSAHSTQIDEDGVPSPVSTTGENGVTREPIYGDPAVDAGSEVRFSVELTRLDRLTDTYVLDIRRMKGNLRSYKFLYDTIRERAQLTKTRQ